MKICTKCGSMQNDNVKFCSECGNPLGYAAALSPQPQYSQPMYQQPMYQQPYAQPAFQGGAAAANNNKKKTIIIVSSVVVGIGIILLILFLFVFKSKTDLIVGTWKLNGQENSYSHFYKDGTANIEGDSIRYTIEGDTLTLIDGKKNEIFNILELTNNTMILRREGRSKEYHFTKVGSS